jgi:membrane-bound serine protease (ClpP class)
MSFMKFIIRTIFFLTLPILFCTWFAHADDFTQDNKSGVLIVPMQMMILPGTSSYLEEALSYAEKEKCSLVIISLDTPGGLLTATQEMVQRMFNSQVPVVVYISPSGGTATSAGVFITLAAHVAAVAPGTSIGAAHPVSASGDDISSDMREKVSQMAAALVKSISERRGRNTKWSEEAVLKSSSITAEEAVNSKVVDFMASSIDELLTKLKGRTVRVISADGTEKEVVLGDMSDSRREIFPISFKHRVTNVLANPTFLGVLWLFATTGIAAELYHPGLIIPGVTGIICLILALAMSQVIPLNVVGIVLIVVGGILFVVELSIPSGIFGLGGLVSVLLGLIWLVDITQMPGVQVSIAPLIPPIIGLALLLILLGRAIKATLKAPLKTGAEFLPGRLGRVIVPISSEVEHKAPVGMIEVAGELWKARTEDGSPLQKDSEVLVLRQEDGLILVVSSVK